MENEQINSLKDLQLQIPRLLDRMGNNQELTHIAIANPILALEKAGLRFSPEAKNEIANHIRFGKEKAAQYHSVQQELKSMLGKDPDELNASSIAEIIVRKQPGMQEHQDPHQAKQKSTQDHPESQQQPKSKKKSPGDIDPKKLVDAIQSLPTKQDGHIRDPLEDFSSLHPAVPLLLKKRRLEFENPAFASEKDQDKVIKFIEKSPLTSVRFRLNRK